MKIVPIECDLPFKRIEDALLDHEAVVVDPANVQSIEEIELAGHLMGRSMEDGRNIVRKRKYEFLLWLSGKTDLKSAFRILNPKSRRMILVILFGDQKKILDSLEAKAAKFKLKENATALDLERISLSRIRN